MARTADLAAVVGLALGDVERAGDDHHPAYHRGPGRQLGEDQVPGEAHEDDADIAEGGDEARLPSGVTRAFGVGKYVTQHLDGHLDVLRFVEDGEVLLSASSLEDSYPFLSVREKEASRTVLVSNLAWSAGVASFFRNRPVQGFYANRLYDSLVGALQWAVYGDLRTPFPTLQLSNADLTAIVRLDADRSDRIDMQVETLSYLINLAETTGVSTVYGFVSASAAKAGWERLAELGGQLEAVGGQVGTHSRYHKIDRILDEEIAARELDGSVAEIAEAMTEHGQSIGKVDFFINPGNPIPIYNYGPIAKRFSFFMTHGFQQRSPLAYGNMSWFAGDGSDLVVVNNTPSPDYVWFYAEGWNYTAAQVTANEEAIFDHMFHNVGRGVLFNQMWHDYSLAPPPLDPNAFDWWGLFPKKSRQGQRALYDALAVKFASHQIYAPDAVDLGQKLRAMAQWSYSWDATDERIRMTLDLSQADSGNLEQYAGGMGVRVENSSGHIQSVLINGQPHPAFDEKVVILPNLEPGQNEIEIALGRDAAREPRLVYVSKRMPAVDAANGMISVSLLTRSKARFSFYVENAFVLLNADWFEWDRQDDQMLHGYVTSDRQVALKELDENDFRFVRSTLPIEDFERTGDVIRMKMGKNARGDGEVWFRSTVPPTKITWDGRELTASPDGGVLGVRLPEFQSSNTLELVF